MDEIAGGLTSGALALVFADLLSAFGDFVGRGCLLDVHIQRLA